VATLPHAYRLERLLSDHRDFRRNIVPLCAAETAISDFVRSFLLDPIHEKYAMGGPLSPATENFIGAEYVLGLHRLVIDLCREAFDVSYADPRPLSGTGAVTSLLMTLSEPGQRILLQTSASGGHASMAPICRRLGLEVVDLPYDFTRLNLDPEACRQIAESEPVDFVLYAPSDLIYAPPLDAGVFPEATTVIYDATQTLGLIASGHLPSPFDAHPRMVLSAGTHKTLPGPSSGLLLTRSQDIALKLDAELSPKFVRHSHPHHTAALAATLIEHAAIGIRYGDRIREHAATLTASLQEHGIVVIQHEDRVSETHQVFLHVPAEHLADAYGRAAASGVTLNAKRKPLFRGAGLRLGVQEIARYGWASDDVTRLGALISRIIRGEGTPDALRAEVREMAALNRFAPGMTLRRPLS
jgi:glycine hydroxymethyltransferase